ncbi:MAG TPA: S8 family serine peptidase, partial [Gemmatimonadales bacterium]
LRERPLGEPPASDVNDNGTDSDSLLVVVGKATDGWVLFADTDGDGTLADERPVHDYLVARESFGWHRGGERPPLTIAANFREAAGTPRLDLFFDTSAHGTHVAGIAAAQSIGGIPGFNGAAPGAQLLALKISRNDYGGITTTGSVLAALEYALRFAKDRRLPLVLNMSFGVGNAREGAARLDQLLDSVLALHPEVVFITSAGNDGPGLSTMGFPGSARRAITVGATEPAALAGVGQANRSAPDALLYFSARGGELAKPDIVVPGIAYSTVPRWNTGDEIKGGTSMASPLAAGIVAILASAALEARRDITADDVRRALAGSARPVPGETALDAGAGVPDVAAAWDILRGPAPPAEFDVEAVDTPGATAAFRIAPLPGDTVFRFRVTRRRGNGPVELMLTSATPWLVAPRTLRIDGPDAELTLIRRAAPALPGLHVGAVRATAPGVRGPVFSLVAGYVIPETSRTAPVRITGRLESGGSRRVAFPADSGRPFRVRMATASLRERLAASLHRPGGAPMPDASGVPAGPDTLAAELEVDGRDARAGYYEAVAVASSGGPVTASITVDHSPVTLSLARAGSADSLVTTLRAVADSAVEGRLMAGILGAERRMTVQGAGGPNVTSPVFVPRWVRRVVIDLSLDPEKWTRFTDFGLTLLDAEGRILGKEPVNYPETRLAVELPERLSDTMTRLVLSPGLADPGSREAWAAGVEIRFEAGRAQAVGTAGGQEFRLEPRRSVRMGGRMGELPWPLPDGYMPLAVFLVESGGLIWTWELPVLP